MEPDGLGLFKVYCIIMSLIYGALMLLAVAMPLLDIGLNAEDMFAFLAIGIVSLPLLMVFAYGLFLPQAKWAWIYGLILIAIGMGSCCFWPICIPLLIKWIDPEFKAWFDGTPQVQGADGW